MADLVAIFTAVFIAELGDKTQLATLLFASGRTVSPIAVFAAAATALVLSTALAVVLGSAVGRLVDAVPLRLIAGIGFVAIGLWMIGEHLRAA